MEKSKYVNVIQNFGRKIILNNIQKKFLKSSLFTVETKSFAQLRKVQRDNQVKGLMESVKSLCKLSDKDLRIIEMGIVIAYHPSNLFGDDKSKWHPQDEMMHKHCEFLLVNLLEQKNPTNLKIFFEQFIKVFKTWKEGDKNRTIEAILISYNYRAEHLEKIKSNDKVESEQKLLMIKELNQQLESLIKSLLMIDKNFPINLLKENHKKLFETYKKGWEGQFNNIRNVVLDSYKKHLLDSINNGNLGIIRNEIVAISERIIKLSPKKIVKSLSEKLSKSKIDSIFYDDIFSSKEFIQLLLLLVNTTIIFDSIDNDKKNIEWKENILNKMDNLKENLPTILLEINYHLDDIINQIKKLA